MKETKSKSVLDGIPVTDGNENTLTEAIKGTPDENELEPIGKCPHCGKNLFLSKKGRKATES